MNSRHARDLQEEMNYHRRDEVKKYIKGFIAATVDYSERKAVTEIAVWVRGEEYGLSGDYRLNYELEDPQQEEDWANPESVWKIIGEQLEEDAQDHIERLKNGRHTGDGFAVLDTKE